MTEQVNVTDSAETEVSDVDDYDAEWDLEETDSSAKPTTPKVDEDAPSTVEVEEKAVESDTVSAPAEPAAGDNVSPDTSDVTPAEELISEDIWANASPSQREAFLKAQNDFKAMKGRHKNAEHRAAALQTEFEKVQSQLVASTRKKGVYEQEHPELFQEVKALMDTERGASAVESGDASTDELQVVFKVHPDVQDVMATEEWQKFISELTAEQQNKFNSSNPYDFIDLVGEYKQVEAVQKANIEVDESARRKSLLEEASPAEGKSSQPDPTKKSMSDEDAYDTEWARED